MTQSYNEIYINARKTLRAAGVENYNEEARLLVAEAAGKSTASLLKDLTLFSADGLDKKVNEWIKRRIAGEPLAYIAGAWEFNGIRIILNKNVLIPRADTEIMAQAAEQLFVNVNTHPRILDLCCGSGCIGCSLAAHMPAAHLVLVDKDRNALQVTRENIKLHRFDSRVMCVQADATKKPPVLLGNFDLIVCNAPYIPTAEIETLDPMVKDYEPILALDGGEDGLDIIRPVISLWKSILRPGGVMMLEICEGQSETVQGLMEKAGFIHIHALKDPGDCERVIIGQLK